MAWQAVTSVWVLGYCARSLTSEGSMAISRRATMWLNYSTDFLRTLCNARTPFLAISDKLLSSSWLGAWVPE
ncbi:hypothetical protein B0H10DRAFT_2039057 [Mycena sp. CBHHK59/15]|nr:hypothetical protein B0H10DRAFT_2039057 [Mycena sp. CBHHK59/15]